MVKKVEIPEDSNLENSLNQWYLRGFANWKEGYYRKGKDGEWGGSLHNMSVGKIDEDTFELYVDFGSVDFDPAVSELVKAVNNSGYGIFSNEWGNWESFNLKRIES
jgi:hypothetical protein